MIVVPSFAKQGLTKSLNALTFKENTTTNAFLKSALSFQLMVSGDSKRQGQN